MKIRFKRLWTMMAALTLSSAGVATGVATAAVTVASPGGSAAVGVTRGDGSSASGTTTTGTTTTPSTGTTTTGTTTTGTATTGTTTTGTTTTGTTTTSTGTTTAVSAGQTAVAVKVSAPFAVLAGSQENAIALANALRTGTAATLNY